MKSFIYLFILFFSLLNSHLMANENTMILKLEYGDVEIQLYEDKAALKTQTSIYNVGNNVVQLKKAVNDEE